MMTACEVQYFSCLIQQQLTVECKELGKEEGSYQIASHADEIFLE